MEKGKQVRFPLLSFIIIFKLVFSDFKAKKNKAGKNLHVLFLFNDANVEI